MVANVCSEFHPVGFSLSPVTLPSFTPSVQLTHRRYLFVQFPKEFRFHNVTFSALPLSFSSSPAFPQSPFLLHFLFHSFVSLSPSLVEVLSIPTIHVFPRRERGERCAMQRHLMAFKKKVECRVRAGRSE